MSIQFKATLFTIGPHRIIRIPHEASEKLPSRGMVMISGSVNDFPFTAPLEPDGKGSHWFEPDEALLKKAGIRPGDTVSITAAAMDEWPQPEISQDIQTAIAVAGLADRWDTITTKARWDWLRWIRATKNPATRQKRISVACSKLQAGENNPCCFDRSSCTVPEVSKSGVLLEK